MNKVISSKKLAVKKERQQQKLEGGFVSTHYPEVASIVINMMYSQTKGLNKSLPRTINFAPDSYAFFRVECLIKDCIEGGFNLTEPIIGMIANRDKTAKGELVCEGDDSEEHSSITYEVVIQYV